MLSEIEESCPGDGPSVLVNLEDKQDSKQQHVMPKRSDLEIFHVDVANPIIKSGSPRQQPEVWQQLCVSHCRCSICKIR